VTQNTLYNYDNGIIPTGLAKAPPIIQNLRAIEAAFAKLDVDDLQRILDLLREIFPSLQDGGAIFTKYWPMVTSPVTYQLNIADHGTHIIPLGSGGDLTLEFTDWPAEGTKFATIILLAGANGVVRFPSTVLWQTRGGVPPILKNTADTIVIWRDAQYQSVIGNDVVFAARAGR
jgi:hypothetical protein